MATLHLHVMPITRLAQQPLGHLKIFMHSHSCSPIPCILSSLGLHGFKDSK